MTGSFTAHVHTTATSAADPASAENYNDATHGVCADSSLFRVAADGDQWAVLAWMDDAWVPIGLCADRDVADEIVQIANSNPDADDRFTGDSPDSAVPFSTFELYDDGCLVVDDTDRLGWK